MKNRGLLVLFGVFIFLAGLLFLQDRGTIGGGRNLAIPTAAFTRVFPDLAVLDIQAIQLEAAVNGQIMTIGRLGSGEWAGVNFSDPVDQNLATTIARSVVLLPYIRTIEITEETNLAQYGFSPSTPPFLISVLTTDNQTHIIAVGDPLQTGPEFYALIDDRDEIYVVQRSPIDYMATFLSEPPVLAEGASITP